MSAVPAMLATVSARIRPAAGSAAPAVVEILYSGLNRAGMRFQIVREMGDPSGPFEDILIYRNGEPIPLLPAFYRVVLQTTTTEWTPLSPFITNFYRNKHAAK